MLFEKGYLGTDSMHCRANTLDLTIIPIGKELHTLKKTTRKLTDGSKIMFLDDGTCDMYTSFDYFGPASHSDPENNLIPDKQALKNRYILRTAMESEGFSVLAEEWWHFRYTADENPTVRYDFPIIAY